jgi:hypothetical protein
MMPENPKKRATVSGRQAGNEASAPAGASNRETRERTVQYSVSLRPTQWKRLDVLGDLTKWGRSGALAEAVDLLTSLPIPLSQRLATLSRTTARDVLFDRFRTAVEQAVAAAEAQLGDDPWAEFDAALVSVGEDVARSGVAEMEEDELIALAQQTKREVRRERRQEKSGR